MIRREIRTLAILTALAVLGVGCKSKPEEKGAKDGDKKPPSGAPSPAGKTSSPDDWSAILKKYVKDGKLDYASLKANADDMARLDAFMTWQGNAKVSEMSKKAQEAFYINAYNSCCVKAVLDHYPVHCPLDIAGFFDKIKFKVGGEDLTVNNIEYDRLIPNYKDMRSHMAIVCADRGCLPIRPEAYTEANLDRSLEEAMQKFVTIDKDAKAATQFKVEKDEKTGDVTVWVSKEFEWYAKDFTSDPNKPASRPELFLKYWVDDETKKLLESGSYKLKIVEWGWTLNETLPTVTAQAPAAASAGSPDDLDFILKKYVKDGLVDYAGLKKNAADLGRFEAFMKWQAEAKVADMSPKAQQAFYINAYNSCCMKAVLDRYPVHCPLDIAGFFDKIKFKVGGEDLTVNNIEYDRLIPNYKDMRSHMAIVCADRGCLPLRSEVYTEANLDQSLDEAMKKFVTIDKDAKAATQFKVEKDEKTGEVTIWLSKEFEWYGKDFTSDPNKPAAKPELFLSSWVDDDTRKVLESGNYKIKIVEWGWTLNEKLGS